MSSVFIIRKIISNVITTITAIIIIIEDTINQSAFAENHRSQPRAAVTHSADLRYVDTSQRTSKLRVIRSSGLPR